MRVLLNRQPVTGSDVENEQLVLTIYEITEQDNTKIYTSSLIDTNCPRRDRSTAVIGSHDLFDLLNCLRDVAGIKENIYELIQNEAAARRSH